MKYFIVVADYGRTLDPLGEDVENLQVMGFVQAENLEEAKEKINEEEWYNDAYEAEVSCDIYELSAPGPVGRI